MTRVPDLARVFVERLDVADRDRVPADLEARLAAQCQAARAAYPELAIDDAELVRVMAAHARGDVAAYLGRCRSSDLALALRCAAGDSLAIAAFERGHRAMLDGVIRRFVSTDHSADDLRQILYSRLLVGEGARPPKIADYQGQGFLENWLRVTAVRTFLDLRKRKDRARESPAEADDVLALPSPGDLALDHLKDEYRPIVAAALLAAARALPPGERMLLRQHMSAGMTIDQLAGVLGVHRATVARRIERARGALLDGVRAALAERLGLPPGDVDGVIALVTSWLDVSVARLFASTSTPS
jgi:RNA polymerase sigma-70 factor (ECF subfamily)